MSNRTHIIVNIDHLIRFFIYVIIFWLPYSTAVIEVSIGIGLFLFIIKRTILIFENYSNDKGLFKQLGIGYSPKESILNKPIGLFLCCCILAVLNSFLIDISWHKFLTKTLEWFIVYFLVLEVFTTKRQCIAAIVIWIITTFATAIDSMIQYYITSQDIFLKRSIIPGSRATAGFRTPNSLGAYYIIFIPAVIGLFISWKHRWKNFILIPLFILSFWSLLLSFSRGAFFCIFLATIFIYLGHRKFHKREYLKKWIISFGLIFVVVFGILFSLFVRSSESMKIFDPTYKNFRLSVWADSLKMIRDKPIFGHGINTYMKVFQYYRTLPNENDEYNPTYAHNCYLQIAVETGVLGVLAFSLIILGYVRHGFRHFRESVYKNTDGTMVSLGLFTGICAFLLHSAIDTNFYSLQLSTYIWLMIGMHMALKSIMEDQFSFEHV